MVKYCQNKLKFHLVVEKDRGNTWKKIRKIKSAFFAIFFAVSVFTALTVACLNIRYIVVRLPEQRRFLIAGPGSASMAWLGHQPLRSLAEQGMAGAHGELPPAHAFGGLANSRGNLAVCSLY
jgi:hypothetical protein